MLRSAISALIIAVAPLSAAAAQTTRAHDHAAPAGAQAAQLHQAPATPQGKPMGGMTGQAPMASGSMAHDHAMRKDGQVCDCPCMKQDKDADAATKTPPAHDHTKEHKQQ